MLGSITADEKDTWKSGFSVFIIILPCGGIFLPCSQLSGAKEKQIADLHNNLQLSNRGACAPAN